MDVGLICFPLYFEETVMKQLLIISKKKVFRTYAGSILIPYDGADGDSLKEWVSARYNMSMVKTQKVAKSDIVVLTVVEKQHCVQGEYISIAKAIELIDNENEPLRNYLNNLRVEFDIQLEYGVQNGKIINIMDLPVESKGLQCDCVCPGCGGRLVARKGAKKKHHFAHYNEPCNLVAAQQTALHMLAKEIIEEEKSFLFPGYSVSRKDLKWAPDYQPYDYYQMPELQYREPYRAKCESVTLERKISDFVPDIIVSVRGKICLIEIAVTHFVDEEKQKKIESVGLPMVEVDLSSLHGQSLSREVIRDVLVNQTNGKTWVYNPLRKEALVWAASEYQRRYDALVEAEEKKLAERKRKAEQSKQKRTEATTVVEELMRPENYKKAILELRSDKAFNAVLSNLSFRRAISDQLPFFVDIPITGEMVFACDRRVWQSAIFDKFIYNRAEGSDGYTRYSNDKIHGCVKKYMPFVPINWKLAYGVNVNLGNGWRKLTLLYDVIEKYIEYLIYIGFLEKSDYRAGIVTRTHSLIPPNETEAKLLENAIKRCDCYSPLIDDEIEGTLYPSEASSGVYNYAWGGDFDSYDHPTGDPTLIGIENRQDAEREIGYGDAQNHNFESGEPFFDCFGKRWVVCKCCGQIKREDEMKSYGGRGSENKGICNECSGW